MSEGPAKRETMQGVLLIAACVLALVSFRTEPVGMRLAIGSGGVSFLLNASSFKIAFDIGQVCSKTDICRGLIR